MSLSKMFLNVLFLTFLVRPSSAVGASFIIALAIFLTDLFLATFLAILKPFSKTFLKALLKPLPRCRPTAALLLLPFGAALCL